MGCGRSSLGSPKASDSDREDYDCENSDRGNNKSLTSMGVPVPPVPANPGRQLLAQTKMTGSQLSFFRMLDKKIENGQDYESSVDDEELNHRMAACIQNWMENKHQRIGSTEANSGGMLLHIKPFHPNPGNENGEKKSTENSDIQKSGDTEEEEKEELIKEQYMFMGNIYTLTRRKNDASHCSKVDMVPCSFSTSDIYHQNDGEKFLITQESAGSNCVVQLCKDVDRSCNSHNGRRKQTKKGRQKMDDDSQRASGRIDQQKDVSEDILGVSDVCSSTENVLKQGGSDGREDVDHVSLLKENGRYLLDEEAFLKGERLDTPIHQSTCSKGKSYKQKKKRHTPLQPS